VQVVEPCIQKEVINNLKEEIKELKEQSKVNSRDINNLKESQAETKIYVKQIFERIEDIKAMFTTAMNSNTQNNKNTNETWVIIVKELIKAIGVIAGIIAGIKLLGGG